MNTKLLMLILCTITIIPQQACAAEGENRGLCARLCACLYGRPAEAPIAPAADHEGDHEEENYAAAGVVDEGSGAPAGAGAPAIRSILKKSPEPDTANFELNPLNEKDRKLFASLPICIRPTNLNKDNIPVFCAMDDRTPYLLKKITVKERCILTAVAPKDIGDAEFMHAVISDTCSEFTGEIIKPEFLDAANAQWFTSLNTFKALAKLLHYITQHLERYCIVDLTIYAHALNKSLPNGCHRLGPLKIIKDSVTGILKATESFFETSQQSACYSLVPLLLNTLANFNFSTKEPMDQEEFKILGIIINHSPH